jgi:hypothetical protein
VSREMGFSIGFIWAVARGRSWKHLGLTAIPNRLIYKKGSGTARQRARLNPKPRQPGHTFKPCTCGHNKHSHRRHQRLGRTVCVTDGCACRLYEAKPVAIREIGSSEREAA